MPADRARTWILPLVIALVVAIAVGLAGYGLLHTGLRRSAPTLTDATRTGAAAVGQSIAGQFTRALQLGIPLVELPGVAAYLERIVATSPQVEGLALLDAADRPIAATREGIEGVRFPVTGGGTTATLVVAAESPLIDRAVRQVAAGIALTSLLAGALAGGIVAFFLAFRQEPARRRFLAELARVAEGGFGLFSADDDRELRGEAGRALAARIENVATARRSLAEAVATVRAIDFDGSLGRQADAIVEPVESRYGFERRQERGGEDTGGGSAWRVALLLGLYAAALPYVAGFAVDREPETVPAAWVPVLPLLSELAAALLGAALGRLSIAAPGFARAAGCLVLAGCLAGTYWCREYDIFVLLRLGAGLAGGFVAAGLLAHFRSGLRRRDLSLLLIFAALFAAPLLAGIYAEAVGRRSGFLLLGLALLASTPLVAAGAGTMARHVRAEGRGRLVNRADLLLALSVLPAAAILLLDLPLGLGYDAYMARAGAAAVLAAAALAIPALPPLACAAALLAGALALHFVPSQPMPATLLACAALGIGAGGAVKALARPAARPWMAVAAGTAGALLLSGAAAQYGLPLATAAVLSGLFVAALGLVGGRPAETAPA